MTDRPLVSVVTPVYNGSEFIAENLRTMVRTLERLGEPFEILVVSDGSLDETPALCMALEDDRIVTLAYPINKGKGFALSYGISRSRGRYVGWLDADLDIAADFVPSAIAEFRVHDVDAVIGSKRHPNSSVNYPLKRRIFSAGYQLLVRALFRINVRDTQVGAKIFRREMLDTVVPLLLVKRYAFDLEVLAVGAEFGFDRVTEAPVNLAYQFTGTGIGAGAVRNMLKDTLAIAYRIHLRHWYVRRFAALQRERVGAEDRVLVP